MSLARTLLKLAAYQAIDPLASSYTNPGMPDTTVSSIGAALDYIVASMFPNARESVATENDLPLVGNTTNDYRIALNYNGTGQAAGFRWYKKEGQASEQWNLVQAFDGADSILQQWETNASGLFVLQEGVEDVAGQTIHGSSLANGDLTLSPNSGDGTNDPALQTGHIKLFGSSKPTADNIFNLGAVTERFANIFLAGLLSDGTSTVSVAQALTAYNHSQVTSGNPHSVAYEELLNRLGNVTVNGDVGTTVVDFSTQGNKTITLNVTDDSHNHTTAFITDFNDATWALLKARLVDTSEVTWTFDDGLKTASADVTVDTSSISDIASPAVNKILVANGAGDEWITSDGTVELTGDVTGSGTYNSSTDKIEIASTVANVDINSVDRINTQNLSVSVATTNPAQITQANHGMQSGRKIRLFGPAYAGEYTITFIDANTYSIAYDNSLGSVDAGYVIPNASQFLYDSLADEWQIKLENAQLSHNEISDLTTSDDHTQYVLGNGRTDGTNNKVYGGEVANGNLYLGSTSHATKGNILFEDNLVPETGASYSGGWSGTDIGGASQRIRDINMRGTINGLRLEVVGSLPTATIEDKARLVLLNGGDAYITKDGIAYKYLIDETKMGVANGVCPLNGSVQIDSAYLPSYVDDVLEYANFAALPGTGETGKIYITLDDNKQYRWSGSVYVQITSGAVDSVNGYTGVITLTTSDIAEGTNLYYTQARFDSAFTAKNTDNLSEGATNLYFTDTRAKTAAVVNSTAGSETDQAPSVAAMKAYADAVKPLYEQVAPSGTINGSNVTFTLPSSPSEDKAVQLFQAGLMQRQGVDYTISGTTITMTTAPNFGQDLWAYYTKG